MVSCFTRDSVNLTVFITTYFPGQASDEVAEKFGTSFKASDLTVLKETLEAIGGAGVTAEQQRVHFNTLKRFTIPLKASSALVATLPSIFVSYSSEQPILEELIEQKWLRLDGNSLRVGPRAVLELPELLESVGIERTQAIYH